MSSSSNDARYALLIAAETYVDEELSNLAAPARDAQRLQAVLRDPLIGNFRDVRVLPDASSQDARFAVEEFFTNAKPDDILVFHFGGHAFKDERSDDLYLALADTQKRAAPRSTSLTGEYLQSVIKRSPARRVLLILDCCHGGALIPRGEGPGPAGVRAEQRTAEDFRHGVRKIVPDLPEDAAPATGTIVIAAARDRELAHETDTGLLTGAIVHGLRSGDADVRRLGVISTDDLFSYVTARLAHHPDQHPVRHELAKTGSFIVAENRRVQATPLPPTLDRLTKSENPDERLTAIRRLCTLAESPDLPVARSARLRLRLKEEFDTEWSVHSLAHLSLAKTALKAHPLHIDFGTVPVGTAPAAKEIAVSGPPLARQWRVDATSSASVVARRSGDVLRISLRTDSPGRVDATVRLRSEAGDVTISVTADLSPPPPVPADSPADVPAGPLTGSVAGAPAGTASATLEAAPSQSAPSQPESSRAEPSRAVPSPLPVGDQAASSPLKRALAGSPSAGAAVAGSPSAGSPSAGAAVAGSSGAVVTEVTPAAAGRVPAQSPPAVAGRTAPTHAEPIPPDEPIPAPPADAPPSGPTPAGVAPAGVAPAGVAPAGVAPAEVAPAGVAPAEVAPAEVAPAEVAPAEVAPADPRRRPALRAWPGRHLSGGPPRRRTPRWTAPARRVAVGVGVLLLAAVGTLAADQPQVMPWCIPTEELRVLTNAQVRDAVAVAATKFVDDRTGLGGCAPVHISINSAHSDGSARALLGRQWPEAELLTAGPQPDVWLPESSAQVEWLRSALPGDSAQLRLPSASAVAGASIASSPLVLAVPATQPEPAKAGWAQVLDGRWRIPRADPSTASGALLATYAMYSALPGAGDARVVERLLTQSQGADDPRYDLCQLRRQAATPPAKVAYLVPQKYVRDYNDGRPLGADCQAQQEGGAPDARRLREVPFHDRLPALDLPCIPLTASAWGDKRQRELATDFCEFLRDDARARAVLAKHGYANAGAATALPPPSAELAAEVISRWTVARRPWRVLLVMDVSGSMELPVPGSATRRMDVANAAANRALETGALSERDQIGLWTFATKLAGSVDHQQLLPLRPAAADHLRAVRQALGGIEPTNRDTGLYDTIKAGVQELRKAPVAAGPPPIDRMIVLTDGDNYDPGSITIEALGSELGKGGTPVQVSVIAAVGANCGPLLKLAEYDLRCVGESRGGLDAAFAEVFPRAN